MSKLCLMSKLWGPLCGTAFLPHASPSLRPSRWETGPSSTLIPLTAPTDRQVQTEGLTGSSIKVVTAPTDARQVTGSSVKVVTAPGGAKGEAQAGHTDEPPLKPAAPSRPTVVPPAVELPPVEPVAGEPQTNNDLTSELHMKNRVTSPIEKGQAVLLSPGTIKVLDFDGDFSKIFTSDSEIVDVGAITHHSVVLEAKKHGSSDVVFFNTKGELVKKLEVTVDDFVYNTHPPRRDPDVTSYSQVEVHNKAKLISQTNFRCGPDGCHYVGELTAQEPAPLPRGYSNQNQTVNQTIDQTSRVAPP